MTGRWAIIIPAIISLLLIYTPASGQTISGVQEGEPLHLWLKRSPSQDLTTLSFYEPQVDAGDTEDPRFRHTIGQRGEDNDEMIIFFPTHQDSNFLQFEFNDTLKGSYNFTMSAVLPINATDLEFRLEVTMEFSEKRGDEPDMETVFIINGTADSEKRTYSGEIDLGKYPLDRFDGEKGGRLKITIERDDRLDTDVLLYCGYRDGFCSFDLPYSKYRYVPDEPEDEGFDWTTLMIIVFGSLVILILVYLAFGIIGGRKEDEAEEEVPSGRKARRRSR